MKTGYKYDCERSLTDVFLFLSWKRYTLVSIVLGMLFLVTSSFAGEQKRVLYISSYHPSFPTFFQQVEGIKSIFDGEDILLDIEYMDTKRFPNREQWNLFHNSLSYKFENIDPYDAIIVADDNALRFAIEEQYQLFNNIPIVFMGVNDIENALAQNNNPQITGVVEAVSIAETVGLMIKLRPKADRIVAIVDNTPSGQGDLRHFYRVAEEFRSHEFSEISLANQTWPDFLKTLGTLEEDSAVLLLSAYKDQNSKTYLFDECLEQIRGVLDLPIFHLWFHGIGDGLIGGKVISHFEQGRTAATITLKILSATPVSNLKVNQLSPNKYVFDYSELNRNHIDQSSLPKDSIILHEPDSFHKKYKKLIWTIISTITVLSVALLISVANILKRIKVENKLKKSEEEFRTFFENTPVSSWLEDFSGVKKHFNALREEGISDIETYFQEHPEGLERCVQGVKINDVNQATLDLHQAKSKEQLFQGLETTFTPESLVVFKKELIDIWNGKTQATYDAVVQTFNDEVRYVTISYKVVPGYEESLDKVLVTLVDITGKTLADKQKNKLEIQLQQAQKMEAIGTLAGGIAHDFNNILAAILGYAEMAREDSPPESIAARDLDKVLEGGKRAKSLVQQILAFSRQDDMERIILQPASIVKETITMLRPSLPTTIEITQDIDAVTGLVFVDPTQLNQILMNLCTNAFHAMEDTGGTLDITLKEVTLSNEDLVHEPDVTAGIFIQLSISDSGTGIAPTVKEKIFDPYFTTKEAGKGTGMGLSMVHGIVKNYGGFISLYSELGEGTVFNVFLPIIEKEALTENEINDQIPIGRERILFVDDEEILTQMGKTMLERLGYHVTVRNSSIQALETFQNQPNEFDLVITDQTMPGMTGSDLSRRMLQIRPDIPIILCTGYSTIISEEKAKSMGIKEFAFKPLAKKDIAKLIRKVLNVS